MDVEFAETNRFKLRADHCNHAKGPRTLIEDSATLAWLLVRSADRGTPGWRRPAPSGNTYCYSVIQRRSLENRTMSARFLDGPLLFFPERKH